MIKSEMPIRDMLQGEFNEEVNLTKNEDPLDAYIRLETKLGKLGLFYDTYAQATITSGGHARNPNLDWIDIVKKNVAYAQAMAEELYNNGQLNPKHTIEASTLGLVNHWKESDYITFWLNTLARPLVTGVGTLQRVDTLRKALDKELAKHDIDLETFNNYKKGAPERAPLYFKLADAYAEAIKCISHNPVEKLVAVSETSGSLGASTERYFAKKMGSAVYSLAIAKLGDSTLPSDFDNAFLVKDTAEIVSYGGQVFDTRQQSALILVKQS